MNPVTLNIKSAAQLLPKRTPDGNKGTFGKVLLICGSKKMVGCCSLATKGALRSGAGLVTLAFPDVLYTSLTSTLTENLFLPLESDENGYISHLAVSNILEAAQQADVIMLGCGIGVGYAQNLITTTLLSFEKPLVLDADALNNLVSCTALLKKSKANIIITPHPGEMARLIGCSIEQVQADRVGCAVRFAKENGVNVLLKGHETVLCSSTGDQVYINKTGNSGLAKGGSGDLLSGIIAGLTPNLKGDVFKAGVLGAFVHGMCADVLKAEMSEYSILPTDCADVLGKVFKIIEESGTD